MDRKDFIGYIDTIQNFYNQRMSEIELDIWYENLSFMTIERFNYILAEIYKTSKFMPKLADILAIHKQIPYTAKKDENIIKQNCSKCKNTGYVFYKKQIDNKEYKYAAVCDCGSQERFDGIKCANVKNKSNYYVPTIEEIKLEIKNTLPSKQEIVRSMNKLKDSQLISEQLKNIIRVQFEKI